MGRTGVAIGLNKGFITTEIAKKKVRARPSLRKGILGTEVVGFAPYEKRVIELIKSG